VFSQRDDDPIPHNTPSKGVSQPTPSTALIEGVTEGNTNQTTTNQLHVSECGKDSTPPPSKPDSLAAQPASPVPKPEAASAVIPDLAPSAPRRSERVTRPSWKKEAVEKQKAKEAEVKAERKTRRETRNQSKLSQEPETMPLEPTTMGNIAQTAYLAAHGHEIPRNFREATSGPDSDQWWKAMHEEIEMLQKRGTWKLIEKPKDRKVIGSRWTYTIKYGPSGEILRYKARLVAQGYSQIPGVDYSDTFSPTVRLDSLRIILHFAASHGWYRGQDDVTGAFLHSPIDHEIFMKQPEGFGDGTDKVANLLLSLYGIKQGLHLWNKYMHQKLISHNFVRLPSNYAVYTRHTATGMSVTAIHVDNALTIANSRTMPAETHCELHSLFEMKEEDPDWLMGFKLIDDHKNHTVTISQAQYTGTLLKRLGMADCNPVSTPLDPGLVLSKADCPQTEDERKEMARHPYREVLGAITWLAIVSRPDLTVSQSVDLGQNNNPNTTPTKDYEIVRVVVYLHGVQRGCAKEGERGSTPTG